MGWVESLHGQIVALDTAPLIYFMERHPIYHPIVRSLFVALDQGEIDGVTSLISLLETLVLPFRTGNTELAQSYRDILFNAQHLKTIPVTQDIVEEAARLRAIHKVRTPDAIQLATALHSGASYFLTNDVRLPTLPGLTMLVVDQLK